VTERIEQGKDGFFTLLSAARAEPAKVRALDLHLEWRDGGLSQPPEDIGDFVNLEHLCLWGMKITDLPASILRCTKLTSLDLTGGSSRPFPSRVFQLTTLRDLRANDNEYYRSTPDRFDELPHLESLSLSSCRLQTLPLSIAKCRNLRVLDVSDNELTSLPDELAALENLEELSTIGRHLLPKPSWLNKLRKLREHDWA
jgi:Leucine-rich repeat (LRR) protein